MRILLTFVLLSTAALAQQSVSFLTLDGGRVCADLYGAAGKRAVVLAHGGSFTKESWREQARVLATHGFRVLALDFRGFGCSTGPGTENFDTAPFYNDVLAAAQYLKQQGVTTVSAVGGSFGGTAAADACIHASPGTLNRVVLLGAIPNLPADQLHCRTLFIIARHDANAAGPRLPGILKQYQRAPQPKQLVILPGSAHAQYLFQTTQSGRVMRLILRFLSRR